MLQQYPSQVQSCVVLGVRLGSEMEARKKGFYPKKIKTITFKLYQSIGAKLLNEAEW